MMHPPPSQGRIKYPLGNISARIKDGTEGIVGPPCAPVKDLSQIWIYKNQFSEAHKCAKLEVKVYRQST